MKGYVITFYCVDGPTCEDDGFVNCANGGLYVTKVFGTKEEALAERSKEVQNEVTENTSDDGCWAEADGYTVEILGEDTDDMIVSYYYDGDTVNEAHFKIEEVEF